MKHPSGRDLTEQEQAMWREFDVASKAAANIGDNKASIGLTANMCRLYQRLVRAGLAPQLRKKYR